MEALSFIQGISALFFEEEGVSPITRVVSLRNCLASCPLGNGRGLTPYNIDEAFSTEKGGRRPRRRSVVMGKILTS